MVVSSLWRTISLERKDLFGQSVNKVLVQLQKGIDSFISTRDIATKVL
jgi:hypothetical protein